MEKINQAMLVEAKKYLRENWEKGVMCPCCNRLVKLYKRPITGSMAYGLILINDFFKTNPDQEWVHVKNLLTEKKAPCVDVVLLSWWGLLEKKSEIRKDGSNDNGYYRITNEGREFCLGKLEVPRRVFLFNDTLYGKSKDYVSIKKALGKKFNYEEIMQN